MHIAIVGSGIAGLAAAHRLRGHARLTLFEAGGHFGGHTNTVDVCLPDRSGQQVTAGVDTGFLVFNERTYPGLIALFGELGIPAAYSDMSFSVQAPGEGAWGACALEWSGSDLAGVFAQRRNLLRPRFIGMRAELLRFNRLCSALAQTPQAEALTLPLQDFLDQHRFGSAVRDWYLLPMLGCIWSCPTDQMLRFPASTMIRFCHNHGLLEVRNRPRWLTVAGGARQYVQALLRGVDAHVATPVHRIVRDAAGVQLHTARGQQRFDAVVLAVHSDQALRLLSRPSQAECKVLGAIGYQPNRAVLHTDASVLPRRRKAWAAWNFERAEGIAGAAAPVCLHYWLNRLQPLPFAQPVLVSLNPVRGPDPASVLAQFDYEHPVFDLAALAAQQQVQGLQGVQRTWFCGAWTGYGFHEDGLQSGYRAAEQILARLQYRQAA